MRSASYFAYRKSTPTRAYDLPTSGGYPTTHPPHKGSSASRLCQSGLMHHPSSTSPHHHTTQSPNHASLLTPRCPLTPLPALNLLSILSM